MFQTHGKICIDEYLGLFQMFWIYEKNLLISLQQTPVASTFMLWDHVI